MLSKKYILKVVRYKHSVPIAADYSNYEIEPTEEQIEEAILKFQKTDRNYKTIASVEIIYEIQK